MSQQLIIYNQKVKQQYKNPSQMKNLMLALIKSTYNVRTVVED